MCDDITEEIIMTSNDDFINETLTRLQNNKACKYVGMTTSPKGNTNKSIIALQRMYNKFSYNIQKSFIYLHNAYTALLAIFMPKVNYQLPSYCISIESMMKIQKIYEKIIIT